MGLVSTVSPSRRREQQAVLGGLAIKRSGRVLVIGGRRKYVEKAKALGLEVLYIQRKEQFDCSHMPYADRVFLADYRNVAELVSLARGIHQAYPVDYAISLTEYGLIPAAVVNDALGLPGNTFKTARLLKDKWAMRRHLNALNISPVAAEVGQEREDLVRFAADYGVPFIVKPVDAAGSLNILAVWDVSEIDRVWSEISRRDMRAFLMEEYLDGPEVSVEAFTFSGRHIVLGVTDKLTLPNFVEVGHTMPSRIDDDLRARVVEMVVACLDAVGLREGPSHTELRLTAKGPRIVESHNRVGGDRINEMVNAVYGVDMDTLAFAWPLGLASELVDSPRPRCGAAIRYFEPEPGVVQEIIGVESVRDRPEVLELELTCSPGGRVEPIEWSEDRVGFVLARGEDALDARERCDELARQVRIITR